MSRKLRVKCLVLDHDDTVVKSTPEINYPSFKKALSVLRPQEELSFERFTELNFVHGFEKLCFEYYGFSEEEMDFQLACWKEASEQTPHAYEGLEKVLLDYVQNGGKICVSTQSLAARVRRDYAAANLPMPELIFDWESEFRKPDPHALHEVMRIYELKPEEVLMVDDLKTGYDMASAAGVPFACAGWSDNQIPLIREFMEQHSTYYVERVEDLEKILYETNSYERIYDVVKQIPKGTVATYGQVAALAGNSRWARVVGYALHVNPDPESIPCYRVVNREGRLSDAFAFGGVNRQKLLLEGDGIEVVDNSVDLGRYQWKKIRY